MSTPPQISQIPARRGLANRLNALKSTGPKTQKGKAVVAQNALGAINQTLQTLIAAATFRGGLPIAGVVLNNPTRRPDDQSTATNRQELAAHCIPPLLAEVAFGADRFDEEVDWFGLAG